MHWVFSLWLVSLPLITTSSSCNTLKSGALVNGEKDVPLNVCAPQGTTLNCDHCTHAGSRTACWILDSRCLSETIKGSYKLENWGYDVNGVWRQNADLTGNSLVVPAVCVDQYGGYCYTTGPNHGVRQGALNFFEFIVLNVMITAVL
mmetsp:Transcript_4721/g.7109  ORF Transcript_4721/g.7109 Transcript_4721/m.7109 type:complete len:147 (-) Transcript_4721:1718-2158(-)